MNPTQTPPPPPTPPEGVYSVNGGSNEPPVRFSRINRGKLIGITSVVVICLGLIGGALYGVNHIFGIAAVEKEKLAAARQANDELPDEQKVYFGDGSDIEQIAEAKVVIACPYGYEDKGDTCEKTATTTVDAKKYTCPEGYQQAGSGASTTCSKIVGGKQESVPATSSSGACENGYNKVGNKCNKIESIAAQAAYSCNSGFVISGVGAASKCVKTTQESKPLIVSCPAGYTVQGSGASASCLRTYAATSQTSGDVCPSGFSKIGSNCQRAVAANIILTGYTAPTCPSGSARTQLTSSQWACTKARNPSQANVPACDSGWAYNSGLQNCTKVLNGTANYTASCAHLSGYVRSGNTCVRTIPAGGGLTTTYSCPSGGNVSGTSCVQTASATFTCSSGFARSGSACYKVSIDNVSANVAYSCAGGQTLKGDKCERTITVDAKTAYTCESSYTLSGTTCSRTVGGTTVTAQPIVSEGCAEGFTAQGSGNDKKCVKQETSSTEKTLQYQCEEGWTRRQSGDKFDCVLVRS